MRQGFSAINHDLTIKCLQLLKKTNIDWQLILFYNSITIITSLCMNASWNKATAPKPSSILWTHKHGRPTFISAAQVFLVVQLECHWAQTKPPFLNEPPNNITCPMFWKMNYHQWFTKWKKRGLLAASLTISLSAWPIVREQSIQCIKAWTYLKLLTFN